MSPRPSTTFNLQPVRPFRRVAACLVLVGLTLGIYAQMWDHQFINYDDGTYVTENPHVRTGITADNLLWAFSRNSAQGSANWHPLTWWSLMLDAQLYGSFAGGFRLTNLLLHTASSLMLVWILVTMTGHWSASWFVGVVFAVHPLHVESVAWIAERKDVLSLFFGLLSIRSHLQFVRTRQPRWYALALTAFAMSLMSKQMLVTLPCVLLLLDYWPLRRARGGVPGPNQPTAGSAGVRDVRPNPLSEGACADAADKLSLSSPSLFNTHLSARPSITQWWLLVREKWGYFFLTLMFSAIAVLSQTDGRAVGTLHQFPMVRRILNALCVYVIYLWQTLVPRRLAVFYPYPEHSLWIPAVSAGLLLAVISIAVYRLRRSHPWLVTGWLWFLGSLVPVIGIVQIGMQRMADRYMYFPMIGLLIAVTWLAKALAGRRAGGTAFLRILAGLVIAVYTVLAWRQVGFWQSTATLFAHAVDVAESSLSWNKLGYEYALQGDVTRASNCFHRALRIDPDYAFAHVSLGNVLLAEQRLPEAEEHFRRATRISPTYDEAHYNLGIALLSQGRADEAIPSFERAIELTPDDPQAFINLGIALSMTGSHERAVRELQYGLQLNPASPEAHFNLARIYADEGAPELAVQHLTTVVQDANSRLPKAQRLEAFLQLEALHAQLGQNEQAQRARSEAERLQQAGAEP